MPAMPDPFPFDWLSFLHLADEDTRPCPVVDDSTQMLPAIGEDDALLDLADAARVEGKPLWTTVDALNSPDPEGEFVAFASVGRDGVIAIRTGWPVGTEVMVTVQRMGIGGL